MRALILFHLKSGIRVAVRSFAPLFCAIIAVEMINMYPAAAVRILAAGLFGGDTGVTAAFGALAFLLPVWGAGRLATGLNGWMLHLPLSAAEHRRGLALGLAAVQTPLVVALVLLAIVAHAQGIAVTGGLARLALLLACGAAAALPVRRRAAVVLLSFAAAACAVSQRPWMLVASALLLVVSDPVAGPLRPGRRRAPKQGAGALFTLRTSWRALRWRVVSAYGAGLLVLGATALFVGNNDISGQLRSATVRFGGGFALAAFLATLAEQLAGRRPVWPWARSLPWSSAQRTASDALLLGAAAAPLAVIAGLIDAWGALSAFATLPFLAGRAAAHLRGIPGRRMGATLLAAEGFAVSAALAVLPWAVWVWLAAAPLALRSASRAETRQKVTRWMELHHTAAGDPLSWNG